MSEGESRSPPPRRRTPRRVAAVVLLLPLAGAEPPPQVLQIYQERFKPGAEAVYGGIEEERVRACVRWTCPHAYLALESLPEAGEVWWLNAYTSEADRHRVRRAWESNSAAVAALRRSEPRKKEVTEGGRTVFATFRSDVSGGSCWRMSGTRFFAIATTMTQGTSAGCVFEAAGGTRLVLAPASTRADAQRQAAALSARARVFAVRPAWSFPERSWIDADPEFWKASPAAAAR